MRLDYFEFSRRNKCFIEPYLWPVIEALFAFLDEEMKVLSRDAIESAQMMLRLVPELIEAIDMVSGVDKFLRVINAVMSEIRNIQNIIARKAMSIDNSVWLDCLSNDRNKFILLGIRNNNDVDRAATLEQPEYWNFAWRAASALPFPGGDKVAFIDFNLSCKPRLSFSELE